MSIRAALSSLILAMVLIGSVPLAATAQDGAVPYRGPYAGFGFGLNHAYDSDVSLDGGGSGEFKWGDKWAAEVSAGYAFGNGLRLEGELGQSRADFKSATVALGSISVSGNIDGQARVTSLMANALYDFNTGTPVTPYLGLGAGGAHLKIDTSLGSDGNTDFAWQGIAGAALRLSDTLDATAEFRYFDMGRVNFNGGSVDYNSRALMVGLRWKLGAPPPARVVEAAAPPPPAPEPMPKAEPAPQPKTAPKPTPAPAAKPVPRSFLIFFDWNNSAIRPDARQILEAAAKAAKQGNFVQIRLTGHADRSGPARYNQRLSLRRAVAARAVLVSLGLKASNIAVEGKGETQPLVSTADGVREPRNRRVEIIF